MLSALLQSAQCVFQTLCLFGTSLCALLTLKLNIKRRECFMYISFYVYSQAAQGVLMLIIMLDLLILIKFPLQ